MLAKIYSKTKQTLKTADKLTAVLMVMLLVLTMCVIPVFATDPAPESGDGSGEGSGSDAASTSTNMDASISYFSGLMTNSFSNAVLDSSAAGIDKNLFNGDHKVTSQMEGIFTTAGNVVGFKSGTEHSDKQGNIWTHGEDNAGDRLSIDTLLGLANQPDNIAPIAAYIMWGSTLYELGIDELRDAQSANDGFRKLTGYVTYICFILAYSASGIMKAVTDIIEKFNIFNAFENLGSNLLEAFGSSKFITDMKEVYGYVHALKWPIFGIMVVLLIASLTVFKSKAMNQAAAAQTRIRNLALRFAIMIIGVPVVGMIYTECITLVSKGIDENNKMICNYIYGEFIDFENWFIKNDPGKGSQAFRLANNAEIKVDYSSASKTMTITRGGEPVNQTQLALDINQSAYQGLFIGPDLGRANVDTSADVPYVFDEEVSGNTPFSSIIDSPSGSASDSDYKICRDLILGYTNSKTITADQYNNAYMQDHVKLAESIKNEIPDINADDLKKADVDTINGLVGQILGSDATGHDIWSHYRADDDEIELTKDVKITTKGIPSIAAKDTSMAMVKVGGGNVMFNTLYNTAWEQNAATGATTLSTSNIEYSNLDLSNTAHSTGAGYGCKVTFNLNNGGMSPLSLYNYAHTKFEYGNAYVYTSNSVSNTGVGLMHYSVTLPYKGIPEIVQLLYVICILFSIGIIGWVFGISLLMNTVVQTIKAVPLVFKMAVGSIQGFVEGLLVAISIAAELLVTMTLYTWSVKIIDFVILAISEIVKTIIDVFAEVDGETEAIITGIISMIVILWATFELIKWRQAITISIKSLITHVLNQVFGVSAQMPTGADSGMLTNVAGLAAAGVAAHALASDGTLDDVVNDLSGSNLGTEVGEKLSEGDVSGAVEEIKDHFDSGTDGGINRGQSDTAEADAKLAASGITPADGGIASANAAETQTLTTSQSEELNSATQHANALDTQADQLDDWADDAEARGDYATATQLRNEATNMRSEASDIRAERDERRAEMQQENYEKAVEKGVADYATSLKTDESVPSGKIPTSVEGDNTITDPTPDYLSQDAQEAYNAAKEGGTEGAATLRRQSEKYNAHGLTEEQAKEINEMVTNGATPEEVAAAVDNYAQANFGDDASKVIDKMNEAAGRSGSTVMYGSNDNSEGNARLMEVGKTATGANGGYSYQVGDIGSGTGLDTIRVDDANGASTYTNMSAIGRGEGQRSIQTLDMGGQAAQLMNDGAGAVGYAANYNATADMIRYAGGSIDKTSGGVGGSGKVSVSEMAAMSSQIQMANQGVDVGAGYGDNSAIDVARAVTYTQAQATSNLGNAGYNYNPVVFTPDEASAAAAADVGFGNGNTPTVQVTTTPGSSGTAAFNPGVIQVTAEGADNMGEGLGYVPQVQVSDAPGMTNGGYNLGTMSYNNDGGGYSGGYGGGSFVPPPGYNQGYTPVYGQGFETPGVNPSQVQLVTPMADGSSQVSYVAPTMSAQQVQTIIKETTGVNPVQTDDEGYSVNDGGGLSMLAKIGLAARTTSRVVDALTDEGDVDDGTGSGLEDRET